MGGEKNDVTCIGSQLGREAVESEERPSLITGALPLSVVHLVSKTLSIQRSFRAYSGLEGDPNQSLHEQQPRLCIFRLQLGELHDWIFLVYEKHGNRKEQEHLKG